MVSFISIEYISMKKERNYRPREPFNAIKLNREKQYSFIFGRDDFEVPKGVTLLVSKDGSEIIDADRNIILPQVKYKTNYSKVNFSYKGVYRYFMVHRLVAFAWLGIPPFYHKLVINHKDGNKLNNHVDNLEWVTKALNNRHAYTTGERRDTNTVRSFVVYDFDTCEYRNCFSERHVTAVTGLINRYVVRLIGVPILTKKGKFIILDGSSPLVNVSGLDIKEEDFLDYCGKSNGCTKNLRATNVETGEVKYFTKMVHAAKELGIPLSTISDQCTNPSKLSTPIKGYIFSEIIDQSEPRKLIRKQNGIDEKPTNYKRTIPLIVYDTETGVTTKYSWIGDFCDFVSKKHGKEYIYKSIQHMLIEKEKLGSPLKWKEFEFEILRDN